MIMPETSVTKRSPGRPKDVALTHRRQEDILEIAERTFAKHGYQNTDVQWIADALDISKGTVYRYFPSKQSLFLAAVDRGVRRVHEHISSRAAGLPPTTQRISASVEAYLEFFKSNPGLVELFIQERAEFHERKKPIYFEHREARRGPWRELISQLISDGVIRQMPVERVLDVLGDVLYGTMFTNHFIGRDKPYKAQAQDILDVLFNGILVKRQTELFDHGNVIRK
jgi:AcrR family transcriptional regulator